MYTVEMCQNLTKAHFQEPTIVLAKAATFHELHDMLNPYLYLSDAGHEILLQLKSKTESIPKNRKGIGYDLPVKREILFGSQIDLALIVCYIAD